MNSLIIAQFLRCLLLPEYLKSLSVRDLLVISRRKLFYTNSSLDLEKVIPLLKSVITEIAENLRKAAVDNKIYSYGVFLAFSKAFDTVNHKVLLSKPSNGIRDLPLYELSY